MIQISGLTFDYPGHRALDNVSLTVSAGSVTALVGPNGAGKTTLLRCIAGLETPISGSIYVDGLDVIAKPREVHKVMGYLSDFYGLYRNLTVAQCLSYAAASQGLAESTISNAVSDTAIQLDLIDLLDRASGSLSRGQRQRVAIGQAIIHRPKVVLLDEPASGLDPEARSSLATLFRQLQREGMTLLVSSHILAELDEYSTHMLSLREGRVLENRPLQRSDSDSETRHIRLQLATPDIRLTSWLTSRPRITILEIAESHASIILNGNLQDQNALLQSLLADGFSVAAFSEQKENLQQSYLQSISKNPRELA
ncbi:MAG TPA: ABC transporter ATP-binding protein [Candidatus Paceibacterota bacterium]